MKQLIFILFILTFLIFKVKSEYKIKYDKEKIVETINCLKKKAILTKLLEKKRMVDIYYYLDDYEDYYEYLVNWCARFCDRNGCENLVEFYFFDDD